MQYRKEDSGRIALALTRGEAVRGSIEGLAAELGIGAAQVSAIGAVEDPVLGWYDLDARVYRRHDFSGLFEVISCQGNLSLLEGKPFLHAHVALTQHGFDVKGGHLFDARVGLVLEAFVQPLERPIQRSMDDAIGLAGWALEESHG